MDQILKYVNYYIIALAMGAIFLLCGLLWEVYEKSGNRLNKSNTQICGRGRLAYIFSFTMKLPVIRRIKKHYKTNLEFAFSKDSILNTISDVMIIIMAGFSITLILLLNRIGQLWYVKVMIIVMSIVLPYYLLSLVIDLHKYRMNTQIPKLIDEFRSAFLEHNKIKPALRECSRNVNKNIGRLMLQAADSSDTQKVLESMRDRIDNIWFSIFVVMLQNYKENGGDLIGQLYKLNNTMSTQLSIEKKKNRRLLWYEIFAVCASILSIPAVLWINRLIIGNDVSLIDPDTNLAICRVIAFSVLSLVVVRILRKM